MPTEPAQPPHGEPSPDDNSPVGDDEQLMRRVLRRLVEYDPNKAPPLQAGAFTPTKHDTDGLSLNRRASAKHPSFLTPEALKGRPEVPENIRQTCGVVEVSAASVREVGLTVEPDPAPTPGHVLIKEITWQRFEDDRQRVLE